MRILHIISGKVWGRSENYAAEIILSLHDAGLDQCVVISKKTPRYHEIVEAGIVVLPYLLYIPLKPLQQLLLWLVLKREKPDIIHCWTCRAASLMFRWNNGPVIGWLGGDYDISNFKRCNHLICVTKDILANIVKKGIPSEKTKFIPTFYDIVQPQTPIDRTTLQTPVLSPVLIALLPLLPRKGLDKLLKAAKLMPEVYVWLVGDGPLKRNLKKLAIDLDISDRVKFLGNRPDRSALLRAADICILPSKCEPLGTVIQEAWASKIPLVAVGAAGHVRDAIDGLLVPINDCAALATAIKRVQIDMDLRRHIVTEGYASFIRDYTHDAVIKNMINYYNEIIQTYVKISGV